MKAFEDWVNRKYPQKTKNLKFHVVFVPVSRNQFLPRLTEGRGDLAVGAITITPERAKVVDFSQPMATDVQEIAVTGPHSPELRSIDDLSGEEVFARKGSSYWEHLEELNQRFQSQHKPPVRLRSAPEDLEDEDMLEMLNAGLVSVTSRMRTCLVCGRIFTEPLSLILPSFLTARVSLPGKCGRTALN